MMITLRKNVNDDNGSNRRWKSDDVSMTLRPRSLMTSPFSMFKLYFWIIRVLYIWVIYLEQEVRINFCWTIKIVAWEGLS